jgi:hypothetical protein
MIDEYLDDSLGCNETDVGENVRDELLVTNDDPVSYLAALSRTDIVRCSSDTSLTWTYYFDWKKPRHS